MFVYISFIYFILLLQSKYCSLLLRNKNPYVYVTTSLDNEMKDVTTRTTQLKKTDAINPISYQKYDFWRPIKNKEEKYNYEPLNTTYDYTELVRPIILDESSTMSHLGYVDYWPTISPSEQLAIGSGVFTTSQKTFKSYFPPATRFKFVHETRYPLVTSGDPFKVRLPLPKFKGTKYVTNTTSLVPLKTDTTAESSSVSEIEMNLYYKKVTDSVIPDIEIQVRDESDVILQTEPENSAHEDSVVLTSEEPDLSTPKKLVTYYYNPIFGNLRPVIRVLTVSNPDSFTKYNHSIDDYTIASLRPVIYSTFSEQATSTNFDIKKLLQNIVSNINQTDDQEIMKNLLEIADRHQNTNSDITTEAFIETSFTTLVTTTRRPLTTSRTELRNLKIIKIANCSQETNRLIRKYSCRCYECGLNYKNFGTPNCHMVFDSEEKTRSYLGYKLKRNCLSRNSIGGCFKRFLDVGVQYNERGCREWPPTKGNSYASDRFRALERMLYDVADGCVFSPAAVLTPFSYRVSLYARYHVCVCTGRYCNDSVSTKSRFFLLALTLFNVWFSRILKI